MNKLFRYELRRLLCNKMFFGILLVSLGYGWLTLTGSVILGIANTAPFSPWSFGYYLSRTLPLVCLGELFFLAFFYSKEERFVRPLTQATPVKQQQYVAMRCCAALTGTMLLSLCVVILAIAFYVSLFGWIDCGTLILPALLTLFPPIFFCLGTGLVLGQLCPTMIYLLMAVIFLLSSIPLPAEISFSLSSFYSHYPVVLDTVEPFFQIPKSLILQRFIYIVLGIGGMIYVHKMTLRDA